MSIIQSVRRDLKKASTAKARKVGATFFKEPVTLYGVPSAGVRRIARAHRERIQALPKKQAFAVCEALWRSGVMEESFVACEWTYARRKEYTPGDFTLFEQWVRRYVHNWASCDTLCNHTIGTFLEMYPGFLPKLNLWARCRNRWMRRASAVSLIVPARKGLFLEEIFGIADVLLEDQDDMVQKGYGWMLKVASKPHLQEVFDYVQKRKAVMPRTALRYAIELMPEGMRRTSMAREK